MYSHEAETLLSFKHQYTFTNMNVIQYAKSVDKHLVMLD
jgi:hypothetical protein